MTWVEVAIQIHVDALRGLRNPTTPSSDRDRKVITTPICQNYR
jgi:hypothetical protein